MSDRMKNAIRGCLIGGAVGDALGYAVEFVGESYIFSKYGKTGITAYDLDRKTGKAIISDDTQITLLLMLLGANHFANMTIFKTENYGS